MNEKGYTLIEMAVVVLLIGLTIGIAVPKVRDTFAGDNLKKSTRQLIGLTRELRSTAVREQLDYELHIDLDRQKFWSCSADTTPEKRDELKRRASGLSTGIRISDVWLSGNEKKAQGEVILRFFKKGYAQPARIRIGSESRKLALVLTPYIPTVEVIEEEEG